MDDKRVVSVRLVIKDEGTATLGKVISETSKAEQSFGRLDNVIGKIGTSAKSFVSSALGPMAALLGGAALVGGTVKLATGFMDMAKSVDQMQVRLKVMLGDVGEANKLFADLAKYAGAVPFELQEVMNSATTLAGIMKGGRTEVMKWMPLIGDLAASVGLGIGETTEQVMRMLSAGAASADRFRERGVLAMLGFKAGVSYTAQETADKLWDSWTRSESKFRGSTDLLAETWEGTMSMFADAWFQFNRAIADAGAWDSLTQAAKDLLSWVNKLQEEGKLDEWARGISLGIEGAVDTFRELAEAVGDAYGFLKSVKELGEFDITIQGKQIKGSVWEPFDLTKGGPVGYGARRFQSMIGTPINEFTREQTGYGWDERWDTMMSKIGGAVSGEEGFRGPMLTGGPALYDRLYTDKTGNWTKPNMGSDFQGWNTGAGPLESSYQSPDINLAGTTGAFSKETIRAKEEALEAHAEFLIKKWKAEEEAAKAHQKALDDINKQAIKAEEDYSVMLLEVGEEIVRVRDGEAAYEILKFEQVRDERIRILEEMNVGEIEYVMNLTRIWEAYYASVGEYAQQSTDKMKKDQEESQIRMKQLADSASDTIVGAFGSMVDISKDGFDDMGQKFGDMITGMLSDLARLTMQKSVLEPISNALSGALGGLFGVKAHKGGIIPEYHTGGYVPRDTIASLQGGEYVLPRYHHGAVPEGYKDTGTPLDTYVGTNWDRGELSRMPESSRQLFDMAGVQIAGTAGIPYYYYNEFGNQAEALWTAQMMGAKSKGLGMWTGMDETGKYRATTATISRMDWNPKSTGKNFADTVAFASYMRLLGQNAFTTPKVEGGYGDMFPDFRAVMEADNLKGQLQDARYAMNSFMNHPRAAYNEGWITRSGGLKGEGKRVLKQALWLTDLDRFIMDAAAKGYIDLPEAFKEFEGQSPRGGGRAESVGGAWVKGGKGKSYGDPFVNSPWRGMGGGAGFRYHEGSKGLAHDEVAAILQKGEAVIPRGVVAQNRELINSLLGDAPRFHGGAGPAGGGTSGGGVKVQLINETGTKMRMEEGPTHFDGEEYVKQVVLKGMQRDSRFRSAISGML